MKPKPSWCRENCRYAKIGKGFALDSGPAQPKIRFYWEAPGAQESIDGYAAAGPTGWYFDGELKDAGLDRRDVLISNVIRCRPPKNEYPVGEIKKAAEAACRHWDDPEAWVPNLWIVTFHPASVFRTRQYKQYLRKALRLAISKMEEGYRVGVLCGNHAMNYYAPWLKGGVDAWKNHWWEEEGR